MKGPERITHVLVDGVRYPDALRRLYARDDLVEIEPLYLLTRLKDLGGEGPILVAPRDHTLLEEIRSQGDGELARSMSLISSRVSTEMLGDHLRQFVEVEVEGESRLLRFADPLVLRHWLASYGDRIQAEVMGPIRAWTVAHWSPNWSEQRELAWSTFVPDDGPATVDDVARPVNRFTAPQLEGLEAVARWQFKERLTAHFQRHTANAWATLPSGQQGDWLEARLTDAQAWGAQTERQLAIWVDLSLHQGSDFMMAPDGAYARWLASDPEHARLPRQQQLYELDALCRAEASVDVTDETRTSTHV